MTVTQLQPFARIALSGTIIFAVLAAVAGASNALFTSDPAVAGTNTFATGNADLLIASDTDIGPGTYGASIPGANITNLAPGDVMTFKFWLRNNSANTIDLDLTADLTNISDLSGSDLGSSLTIAFTCDVRNTTTRDGSIPSKSLSVWETDPATTLDDGHHALSGTLEAGGTADGEQSDEALCTMTATLDPSSTAENATATFDATFLGTQIIDA